MVSRPSSSKKAAAKKDRAVKAPIDQVLIEGDTVYHHLLLGGAGGTVMPQHSAPLADFCQLLAEQHVAQEPYSFGIIPDGMQVRDVYQNRGMYVFLVQIDPCVRALRWLADDSPADFGSSATYQEVRIALPYVYFFVAISAKHRSISRLNSVYFRNAPLTSLDDPLLECAFFNCSIDSYGAHCWICTQNVAFRLKRGQSLAELVNSFVGWFWGSGFNASSEHHEGASFWGKTRKSISDKRLRSVRAWQEATERDPNFACDVAWLEASRTPRDIYDELTTPCSAWQPTSSKDFAALVSGSRLKAKRRG